jgi:Domain of unknown function (DUF4403)
MKNLLSSLLLAFIIYEAKSQKTEIKTEAPEENYTIQKVITKQQSNINIPVSIAMVDIENQINKSITGLIFEDNSYTDNDNDNFKCKVWKKDKIVFTAAKNNVFDFTVPLKIWAEKGVGAFGLMSYQSTEFEMKLKFTTAFSINPDWSFQTITNPNGFEWITKPVLKFSGVEVPIYPIIGKVISSNHAMFARKIDESVKANISLKPYVKQAWETASQPYLISEEYKTWMKLTPIEISMAPLVAAGKVINSNLNLKVFTETIIGEKPIVPAITNVPNLKITNIKDNNFEIALFNEVPYTEATMLAKKMFNGQKYEFQNGKFKIEVIDLDIYGSEEKLVIKTDLKGSIKGTVYMKGTPVYDSTKKMIVLTNLDYDLKTKSVLLKAANWMLEGKLTKMFQDSFGMPVGELIQYAKKNIEETLSKPLSKGIKMDGEIVSIIPDKVILTPTSIVSIVQAKGKLNLKIDGID